MWYFNGLGIFLVTTSGVGPGAFRGHDLFRDLELAVDLAVIGLGGRGLAEAQGGARAGRQDDGAAMGVEAIHVGIERVLAEALDVEIEPVGQRGAAEPAGPGGLELGMLGAGGRSGG